MQCLSVIKQALDDNSLHPSKRLSLYQRAVKMLQQPARLTGKRKRSSITGIGLCDLTPVDLVPYHEVSNVCCVVCSKHILDSIIDDIKVL